MRYFFLTVALLVAAVVLIAGFRGSKTNRRPIEIFTDMRYQPKFKAQSSSGFFADGKAGRVPVKGTIAMEMPAVNDYENSGKMGDRWGDGIPIKIDAAAMERGRQRYQINCQVCHGPAGYGDGITSKYGLNGIANFHSDRLRAMPDGEIFNVITNGKGQMFPYGANVEIADRWKIVAYVRALQRSQHAAQPLEEARKK